MDPDLTSHFYSSVCARGTPSLQKNSATTANSLGQIVLIPQYHEGTIHYTLRNIGRRYVAIRARKSLSGQRFFGI